LPDTHALSPRSLRLDDCSTKTCRLDLGAAAAVAILSAAGGAGSSEKLMKSKSLGILVAAFAVPALAAEPVVDAADPAELASIIRALGYRAVVETDGVGDPMISSRANGTKFAIYFYGCTEGGACKSLLFKVGYDLDAGTSLDVVNDWNAKTLFGRAYLDDEADPWLEMAVNMDGGVRRGNFEDTFDWWEVILNQFEDHIGF
jgi:hypothetical protein